MQSDFWRGSVSVTTCSGIVWLGVAERNPSAILAAESNPGKRPEGGLGEKVLPAGRPREQCSTQGLGVNGFLTCKSPLYVALTSGAHCELFNILNVQNLEIRN